MNLIVALALVAAAWVLTVHLLKRSLAAPTASPLIADNRHRGTFPSQAAREPAAVNVRPVRVHSKHAA